ncbi:hypothetical protein GJ496_003147 [Pomphorhynchus laevis]|nr:hypothetical protein GJ496_003147 [Pomphorhynchus laevis]
MLTIAIKRLLCYLLLILIPLSAFLFTIFPFIIQSLPLPNVDDINTNISTTNTRIILHTKNESNIISTVYSHLSSALENMGSANMNGLLFSLILRVLILTSAFSIMFCPSLWTFAVYCNLMIRSNRSSSADHTKQVRHSHPQIEENYNDKTNHVPKTIILAVMFLIIIGFWYFYIAYAWPVVIAIMERNNSSYGNRTIRQLTNLFSITDAFHSNRSTIKKSRQLPFLVNNYHHYSNLSIHYVDYFLDALTCYLLFVLILQYLIPLSHRYAFDYGNSGDCSGRGFVSAIGIDDRKISTMVTRNLNCNGPKFSSLNKQDYIGQFYNNDFMYIRVLRSPDGVVKHYSVPAEWKLHSLAQHIISLYMIDFPVYNPWISSHKNVHHQQQEVYHGKSGQFADNYRLSNECDTLKVDNCNDTSNLDCLSSNSRYNVKYRNSRARSHGPTNSSYRPNANTDKSNTYIHGCHAFSSFKLYGIDAQLTTTTTINNGNKFKNFDACPLISANSEQNQCNLQRLQQQVYGNNCTKPCCRDSNDNQEGDALFDVAAKRSGLVTAPPSLLNYGNTNRDDYDDQTLRHTESFKTVDDIEKYQRRYNRLFQATEDAFKHVKRANYGAENEMMLSPAEAAQTVFVAISRPLQKFLRKSRTHPFFTRQSVVDDLTACLMYDVSPKAFLQRYISLDPCGFLHTATTCYQPTTYVVKSSNQNNNIHHTSGKSSSSCSSDDTDRRGHNSARNTILLCSKTRRWRRRATKTRNRRIKQKYDRAYGHEFVREHNNRISCSNSNTATSVSQQQPFNGVLDDSAYQSWTLLCDPVFLNNGSKGIDSQNVFFLLKKSEISLLCQCYRAPSILLIEKLVVSDDCKFVFNINSETSV